MKAHKNWSYAPYHPPFTEVGEPYICRVVPTVDSISFDWLSTGAESYRVFCRVRNRGEFTQVCATADCTCTLSGLENGQEYEFYVEDGKGRSRIRLAKCGFCVGIVVNYLHPEDEAYDFSGRYLCSPSLVRHPEGYLLASMDVFAGNYPQNLTLIFRSDDDGKHWRYVTELLPCFWGKLFVHKGEVYMLGVSTEYGDLLIGKSSDGGKTFGEPTVLLRGSNGKAGNMGWQRTPFPLYEYQGRLWGSLDYGSWGKGYHAAAILSVSVDDDLLDADNWSFSEPLRYDPAWPGVAAGKSCGTLEGAIVEKDGKLWDIMRYHAEGMWGLVLCYEINTENPEAPLRFDHVIQFPCNHSKFEIFFHKGKYYSLANRILCFEKGNMRNLLSLMVSDDCEHWEVRQDVIDYRDEDPEKIGFQYVDCLIEGDEMLFLCRTAMNGADSFHNANYSTFHRIELN